MRNIRFLVIDDSQLVRAKVKSVLENVFGVKHIVEASDGVEALKALQANKIDLIISDWNMPNLSGEELLYNVRNSKEWSDIPFIMMTAHGERDYLITAIQNGVSNYITKPFTPAELEDKILKSWNSATKRKSERYNMIPEHELIVRHGSMALGGQVMNISRTGTLVRLNHDERLGIFKRFKLSLEIMKEDNEFIGINPLHGIAVRLEVEDSFNLANQACLMAVNFIPGMITEEVEQNLDSLLKYLGSRSPDAIQDE